MGEAKRRNSRDNPRNEERVKTPKYRRRMLLPIEVGRYRLMPRGNGHAVYEADVRGLRRVTDPKVLGRVFARAKELYDAERSAGPEKADVTPGAPVPPGTDEGRGVTDTQPQTE